MTASAKTLLISPPLWNVYAPHLAVPLLVARMKQHGRPAVGVDIGIEHFDRVLSSAELIRLGERVQRRLSAGVSRTERAECERALLVLPDAADRIDSARSMLSSVNGLFQPEASFLAKQTVRNALWVVSAAYPRLRFELSANDLYHSVRSSRQVLEAADDPERNVYRVIFEDLLRERLRDSEIGMVGISVSADTQLVAAVTVAKICKEWRPDVRVVMGGNFTTRIATRWAQRHPLFSVVDSFVLYEGEDALPMLAEREWERDPGAIPGLCELDGEDSLVSQPPREVNLDELPPPDYSDLPLASYFAPGPVLPTYASRSCAWSCAFCSIPFASNKFRQRRAERIVNEMEALRDQHGSRYFMFVDEIMTLRSLTEVSRELENRASDLFWYGETRFAHGWTRKVAESLYRSGCRRLNLGLESYNQRVLDMMQKGTKVPDIRANIELLLGAGVPVHLFAIAGFPGETAEEVNRTIEFARQVMHRSVHEFGVPYSTWGMSPFILDLHSPVGQRPEVFGVQVEPIPPDEDLALSARFQVREGLGQRASLVAAARSGVGVVPGRWSGGWFHRASDVTNAEEFTFLRACHRAPHAARGREEPVVVAPFAHDTIRLALAVSWRRSSCGLVSGRDGPCLVVYQAARHMVMELPMGWDGALRRLAAGTTLDGVLRDLPQDATDIADDGVDPVRRLLSLIRFGFVAVPGRAAADKADWSDSSNHHRIAARHDPNVTTRIDNDAGRVELSQPVSGPVLRLNPAAALAWFHAEQAPALADAMDAVLADLGIDRQSVVTVFRELVEAGVLLLTAADGVAVPPARWPAHRGRWTSFARSATRGLRSASTRTTAGAS